MGHPLVEACVEGADGVAAAERAGADRAELCAALVEGGLTPSPGMVQAAMQVSRLPLRVMVRPRGGDFLYSEAEFRAMLADVAAFAAMGVDGVVVGCLDSAGRIDVPRMTALVAAAAGRVGVTCHRAFDMTRDPMEAVDDLVAAGCDRVLTSGQRDTALEGLATLKATVARAAGRLTVIACGALDAACIAGVHAAVGAPEYHFAALAQVDSAMVYRNGHVGMSSVEASREYLLTVTDEARMAATIAALRAG